MPTTGLTRAAIYIKEAAGYPTGENSKELQTAECEQFCRAEGFKITTRYHDPPGDRRQFDWMMGVSGRAGVKPRCVAPNCPSLQEFADNRTMRRMQGAISNEGTTLHAMRSSPSIEAMKRTE